MMTELELRKTLGAVLSADNPQGYTNNVADGLFAIANALNRIAACLESDAAWNINIDAQMQIHPTPDGAALSE